MNPNQVMIDSDWKFVMAVSGGGQEILGELTRYGNMSGTLLEGIVPYAVPAYHRLIGGKPDQIVSPEAARAAAMACYKRAVDYASGEKVFGFASTGSVVKVGGEREGRQHKVCMAIQDFERTIGINFTFKAGRTRGEEEQLVSNCIRVALMWGCHRFADMKAVMTDGDENGVEFDLPTNEMKQLVAGSIPKVKSAPSQAVFSSSCNPLHTAHLNMIRDAAIRLNCKVDIELCVQNMDKPTLDYLTIKERTVATENVIAGNPSVGYIIHTNTPLFFAKAELFPGATFIMGMDTFDRIIDRKYYHGGNFDIVSGLIMFEFIGCKMLVYPRKGYVPTNYKELPRDLSGVIESGMNSYITVVSPYHGYAVSDISSTDIRRKTRNANQ